MSLIQIKLKHIIINILNQKILYGEISKLSSSLEYFDSFKNDEEYLRFQVYSIIAFHSGYEITEISDSQNLKSDLGINNTEKWIFKRKFNLLIKELRGTKYVTKAECLKLNLVGDCIELIKSKLK